MKYYYNYYYINITITWIYSLITYMVISLSLIIYKYS